MKGTLALLLAVTAWPGYAAASSLAAFDSLAALAPSSFSVPDAAPARIKASPLTGEALFQQLHNSTAFAAPNTGKDYLNSKKFMFSQADNTGCGGGPGVTCLYSQVCAKGATEHGEDYKEPGDANGDGISDEGGMNAEHSWPQGFFNKAAPMKSDLHHIFPTFITPNNTRGSDPFGVVTGKPVYVLKSGTRLGTEGYEPADPAKGDIARAILYFVVRYYDKNIRDGMDYKDFWTSRVQMFLDWNRQDPPDANEKRRNDLIAGFQGNRNPFVDDYTLADRVGLKVFQSH
mgnify:FL=1